MLMRTDPFRELDRLTQQFFGNNTQGSWSRPTAMPMDAYRVGDEFVVAFDLPGVSPEAIELDVERNVLESFVAGVEACDDAEARALLERVCDLFALSTIERHRAWYLEHDRLTPDRSKALTATVNQLCAELRPQARTLVEGFGIPNRWLATEMMGAEAI